MLESDKLKRDHEDRGKELSANQREIGALQTGLSPIEERLAAELNASNRRAASLQAQLANITTSQADQVDLTTSDAQETGAYTCRGRAQLMARIKLLETNAMTAREDSGLDRERNSRRIYKEDALRCFGHAKELFSAGQQVEELQRQLTQEKARTANLPPDAAATHVEAEPTATPGPEADGTDAPTGSDTSSAL